MLISRDTTITFFFGFSSLIFNAVARISLSGIVGSRSLGRSEVDETTCKIPLPFSIRIPEDNVPFSRKLSRCLIIIRALNPTESCLFLCLSISSKTLIGMIISLFSNLNKQSASERNTDVSIT